MQAAIARHNSQFVRGKHRNRIQIISELLEVARGGVIKTHLMYSANLSFKMLSQYLDFMLRAGLLKEVKNPETGTKIYKTTSKGTKYLELYRKVQEISGVEE
jgi:predicted transcriptional regulator